VNSAERDGDESDGQFDRQSLEGSFWATFTWRRAELKESVVVQDSGCDPATKASPAPPRGLKMLLRDSKPNAAEQAAGALCRPTI
jgi:hypothetical protein